MDKSQYRLLSANKIDKFDGYDRVVAQNHIANVGCIIVDSTYGDPIDNEYDLEEIYQAIESTKMYESKNRKEKIHKNMAKQNTITLTESELKRVISESVKKVLKESDYFDSSYRDEPYDFRTQDPTGIHKHNGREIPDGDRRSFTMGSFKPVDKYKTPKPKYDEYIEDVYEWVGNAVQRLRNFENVYTHTDENVSIHEEIEKLCFLLNRVYNELKNLQYGLKEIDF